jgi:DNA helicase II / ATP-dependent DNA helicase PcrA
VDKRIIFSVAGSGKTSYIIEQLDAVKRSVIVTYTENNVLNIRKKVIEKFGFLPSHIKVYSYFEFIYSFCYRPLLAYQFDAAGINFKTPPAFTLRLNRASDKFYRDGNNRIYSNRISKLLDVQGSMPQVVARLERYFDKIFIDEVQDFGGHDFDFICKIVKANLDVVLVGDFFQHTFDTSRDGNVNKNIHADFIKYINLYRKAGLLVDVKTLSKSFRCGLAVCDFISNELGIEIQSHKTDEGKIVEIDNQEAADLIFANESVVKLFYENSKKYRCFSENWGASKGQDCYDAVCVVLNKKSYDHYKKHALGLLAPQTKNKLYVACTRSRNELYFVSDELFKKYKQ